MTYMTYIVLSILILSAVLVAVWAIRDDPDDRDFKRKLEVMSKRHENDKDSSTK